MVRKPYTNPSTNVGMEEVENSMPVVTFEPAPCPECGEETSIVNLGNEPPREVCLSFPACNWEGITLL